jgi:hypothetical protein
MLTDAWTPRATRSCFCVAILTNLNFNVAIKRTLKLDSASKGSVVGIPASLNWLNKVLERDRLAQRVRLFLL